MHQRKEKSDRNTQHEAVLNLLHLLETPDYHTVESIKHLIHENLCATRDCRLLYDLVDYYMTVESQRSLEILLRLKEPHDKHLFDKISDLLRNENHRYKSLQLLCNLVYKQPSWLHKIANHRIMNILLNLLKTDMNAPNLMSGLFIVICLLPMIPSQFGPFLVDTFEIFSRLAAWHVKKPSFIVDVYVFHLHIVIYSLFHRLYGMFPCNFLAYLRSFYGGRDCNEENYKVFTLVIKPMLERVRLHPLLVTASKETELSTNRWKKMAYHDIIVDCASISLDAVEGTAEGKRKADLSLTSIEQNVCSYESTHYMSYSSQSSCSVNFESECVVHDTMPSLEYMWTPGQSAALSTPTSSINTTSPLSLKSEQEFKSYSMQLSTEEMVPLDFAIEAKPELLKMESDNTNTENPSPKDSKHADVSSVQRSMDSDLAEIGYNSKELEEDKSVLQAVEAKEDDVDKEVSELTSSQNLPLSPSIAEVRHDTPFCSTTQNLTDEPGDLPQKIVKTSDENTEDSFNSLQDGDIEALASSYGRYRYFSHCGPPPEISASFFKKPRVFRSISCPAKLFPNETGVVPNVFNFVSDNVLVPESDVATCSSGVITTSSAFVPVLNNGTITSSDRRVTYEELIPLAMEPLPDLRQPASRNFDTHFLSPDSFLNSLSPPELLDRYIQLGNLTSLNQLSTIPITSTKNTDWTHFGGKPPPDEITILRNQILLLHNQLLFERHRKDVHSERNRRILGRAKRFRMQEEHIVALKEQITLLEQENRDFGSQVDKGTRLHHQLQIEKEQIENDLLSRILKAEQENNQLSFSNKHLQSLLVSQRKENDEIREKSKKSQAEITVLKHQVERANKKALQCQNIEKNSIFLSKQLILLQDLISHYKDKFELLKENQQIDFGANMMNDTACIEIKDLKQKLEAKSALLDTTKAKISDLEQSLLNLKSKEKEKLQIIEMMKAFHQDEISVREERLVGLKRISVQKDATILSLHKNIETLSEEKRILQQQMNGDVNSTVQPPNINYPIVYDQAFCSMEANSDPKSVDEDIS